MSFALAKSIFTFTALGILVELAAAQTIPLPRPRPDHSEVAPSTAPSACRVRLTAGRAIATSIDDIKGPDACGGEDMVRLEAVMLPGDAGRVEIVPPAVLRCSMAEKIADWVRDDLSELAILNFRSRLRSIRNYAAYHCRSRNNVAGAILSEHGKGNAFDVGPITLINGKTIDPTDVGAPQEMRESWKKSVCARFSTVLGPGSDGYHENHIHLDIKERRSNSGLCQWDIRLPEERPVMDHVPLPQPRPKVHLPSPRRRT